MTMILIAFVVKSVLACLLGYAAVALARSRSAAVRHALLAACFGLLLLLPLAAALTAPFPLHVLPAAAHAAAPPPLALPPDPAAPSTAFNPGDQSLPSPAPHHLPVQGVMLLLWVVATVLAFVPLPVGLWEARRLRRSGQPYPEGHRLIAPMARAAGIRRNVDVLTHVELSTPVTCGTLRPAILLPAAAALWEAADLQRALIHELEHIRRADWLTRGLARAVCAVYWYNPLVWKLRRRLSLEAERACDDAVVGRNDASEYAGQLVGLARCAVLSKRAQHVAMANPSDLARRVRALLDSNRRRGRAGASTVTTASLAAVILAFVIAPATLARAQSRASRNAFPPVSSLPSFTTVSVKPFKMPAGHGWNHFPQLDPQRLTIEGTLPAELIMWAYHIDFDQIAGLPAWTTAKLFAVTGVTDKPATEAQMRLMLRRVLAERFHFAFTVTDDVQPAYALEIAPGGSKLKPVTTTAQCGQQVTGRNAPMFKAAHVPSDAVVAAEVCTIADLLKNLNLSAGVGHTLPIVDRTGLTGKYGIVLWQRMTSHQTGPNRYKIDYEEPLNEALKQEMGLELVKTTAPWRVLHVTRFDPPTPN